MKISVLTMRGDEVLGTKIIYSSDNQQMVKVNGRVRRKGNYMIIARDTFLTSLSDSAMVNYAQMDTAMVLDMRYATDKNFLHQRLYPCACCLLRYGAAKDLLQASKEFISKGYRIVLYDCYRPVSVQKQMWQAVRNINYVAPPSKKSSHNRGAAVDIGLLDSSGQPLDMGTGFDFFGPQAGNDYNYLTPRQKANRQLLQQVMIKHHFLPIRTEWWHFYHWPSVKYSAIDMPLPCRNSSH